MVVKKYEFTGETKVVGGVTLHRIRALRDFGDVTAGTLGGWLASEANLSHDGSCWVADAAKVYDHARVIENSLVAGNAHVFGYAHVYGYARVFAGAAISGSACVGGRARIWGDAQVYGHAGVFGSASVRGNARIFGSAKVRGEAKVREDALIDHETAIFVVDEVYATLTVFKTDNAGLLATRGFFTGTVDEFLAKSKAEHDAKTHQEYQLLMQVARMRILGELPA